MVSYYTVAPPPRRQWPVRREERTRPAALSTVSPYVLQSASPHHSFKMIDSDPGPCFTIHQLRKSPLSGVQGVPRSSIEMDGTERKETQEKVKKGR